MISELPLFQYLGAEKFTSVNHFQLFEFVLHQISHLVRCIQQARPFTWINLYRFSHVRNV